MILGTVLLYIFVSGNYTRGTFNAFLISAANAYGLILCALLLGYGLVDFPRSIWNYGSTARRIIYLEFNAVTLKEAAFDAETDYNECVRVFYIY